jgi:hypothetical protein
MYKTKTEHVMSAAKYVFPAAVVATSITEILLFFFPELRPIGQHIVTLLLVSFNMAAVYLVK